MPRVYHPEKCITVSKQRHARYYSDICLDLARFHFSGEENHINALHVLDFEWENIISGFLFASSKNTTPYLKAVSVYASAFDILKLRLHPKELIRWISLAVSAARKIADTRALAGHLGSLGIAYLDIGNIDKSIDCHKKSLDIANTISEQYTKDALTTNAMGNMGNAYEYKGDFKSAEKCYETALSLSRKLKNPYSEAMDLLNIGNIKSKIGKNSDAIEYVLKAKDIFNKLGLLDKVGSCLGTLGSIYTRLNQLELALDHLERAQKIHTEIGDIQNLGVCIQNIGNVYMEMGKYDVALDYFEEAMNIATASSDSIGIAQRMVNIGSALSKSQRHIESIPYFENAITIAKDIGAHELTFVAVQNLSIVYIELQDIEAAKETISSALSLFPERSIYSSRVESLQRHLHLFNGRPLNELSDLEQVLWIVGQVKSYVEVNDTRDINEYILHMISDINAPPEFQELGRVLKKYIDGEKKLDLSNLPNTLANIVQNELGISNKEY